LDVIVTDTLLYQATLSDVLHKARRDAERAQAAAALVGRRAAERAAELEQQARTTLLAAERRSSEADRVLAAAQRTAAQRVAEAQHVAARRLAEAERSAALLERQERVRRALIVEEVEDRVRAELALDAPPLVALPSSPASEADDVTAPPVPSMADLLRPSPGVTRFLDTLLGPA
jgi:ribonuclease Y